MRAEPAYPTHVPASAAHMHTHTHPHRRSLHGQRLRLLLLLVCLQHRLARGGGGRRARVGLESRRLLRHVSERHTRAAHAVVERAVLEIVRDLALLLFVRPIRVSRRPSVAAVGLLLITPRWAAGGGMLSCSLVAVIVASVPLD